jgi:hypothetical protein
MNRRRRTNQLKVRTTIRRQGKIWKLLLAREHLSVQPASLGEHKLGTSLAGVGDINVVSGGFHRLNGAPSGGPAETSSKIKRFLRFFR